jgi:hypothetical protein
MRRYKSIFLAIFLLLAGGGGSALAKDAPHDLNLDVKEFQLDNGMLFLVVERPATPQFEPDRPLKRPAKPALRICWNT